MRPFDLRIAIRSLGKDPGFALIVALPIALGIAAVSVILALLDALLLRPLASPRRDVLSRVG